jgi:hypothetical protein
MDHPYHVIITCSENMAHQAWRDPPLLEIQDRKVLIALSEIQGVDELIALSEIQVADCTAINTRS